MIQVSVEKCPASSFFEIQIFDSRHNMLPCAANSERCSICKKSVPHGRAWTEYKYCVRDAITEPLFILDAALCDEHWEKRQCWLESFHGIKRGSVVKVVNVQRSRLFATVVSWFDEEYFVDERGFCVGMSHIVKGPLQAALF